MRYVFNVIAPVSRQTDVNRPIKKYKNSISQLSFLILLQHKISISNSVSVDLCSITFRATVGR